MKIVLIVAVLLGSFAVRLVAQPAPQGVPGCVYRATEITLTNLQTTAFRCDINGKLLVQ